MSFTWNTGKPTTKKKYWIVDFSFYIYNGTFAMKKLCRCFNEATKKGDPDCPRCEGAGRLFLMNKDGQITGGLFTVMDQIVRKKYEGYEIVVAFDPPKGDLDRTKLLESYKGNRAPKPEYICQQMTIGEELLCYIPSIDCYTSDTCESDDVMATKALELANQGHKVVVSSDDKDMFPLLDHDNIDIYRQRDIFTKQDFIRKFGFEPKRFNEYLAICGDAADNFNLLKGLGEKAATHLIQTYDHITHVFDDWKNVPAKYQKHLAVKNDEGKIIRFKDEEMDLSLKIATLRTDVPCIQINKEYNEAYVHEKLKWLDFNHVLKHMDILSKG